MENSKKNLLIGIIRGVLAAIAMCGAMTATYYGYYKILPKILEKLEENGKMDNMTELVKHGLPMLTVVILIALLCIIYSFFKNAPVRQIQMEKGFIMLAVAVFTYGVILPYAITHSKGCFDPLPEGVEDVKSMLEITATWFVVQIIPLLITISYHFVRATAKDDVKAGPQENNSECGAEVQNEE